VPKYTRGYRAQYLPTVRELEMLSWAARGLKNKEIAFKLGVEVSTVKGHMDSVNRKLDANDRAHAVFKALRMGWLDRDTAAPMPRVLVLVPKGAPPVEVIYLEDDGEQAQ
jgi:DNA-binding CsgD family transcriptional regulator